MDAEETAQRIRSPRILRYRNTKSSASHISGNRADSGLRSFREAISRSGSRFADLPRTTVTARLTSVRTPNVAVMPNVSSA